MRGKRRHTGTQPQHLYHLIEEHGQEKRISYGYNELFTRQLEMKYLE
ncbi:MAG: hypothetical protein ACLT0Y_03725 [Christensenellales bacterium]